MQHGFQRLVLLGSAGYSRAELPLDGAVSLVAPNNTGKTSLINALQFLLIIDRRRMDFGAHDVEKSRRFYFPQQQRLCAAGGVVAGIRHRGARVRRQGRELRVRVLFLRRPAQGGRVLPARWLACGTAQAGQPSGHPWAPRVQLQRQRVRRHGVRRPESQAQRITRLLRVPPGARQ